MKSVTLGIFLIGTLLTTASLIYDHGRYKEDEFVLSLFFASPYLLAFLAYKIHIRIIKTEPKLYAVYCALIFMFSVPVHYSGHAYIGNSGSGYEWLGAYIVALAGGVISALLLLKVIVQYFLYQKAKSNSCRDDSSKSDA